VVGLSGNAEVSKGISDFTDSVQGTINDIQGSVTLVTTQMEAASPQNVTQSFQGNLKSGVDDTANTIESGKSVVLQYDRYREIALGIGFGAPLVGILITIICYFAKAKPKQFVIYVYCFAALNSCFLWGSFAAHLPASKALTDVCDVLDTYLVNSTNTALRTCLSSSAYQPAFDLVDSDIHQSLLNINKSVSPYGVNISTNLPAVNIADESSVQNLATFVNSQIAIVQAHLNALPANISANVTAEISSLNVFLEVDQKLSYLASCQYLQDLFHAVKSDICSSLTKGLELIAASDVVCAALLWPSTVLVILAFRYLALSTAPSATPMTAVATTTG